MTCKTGACPFVEVPAGRLGTGGMRCLTYIGDQ